MRSRSSRRARRMCPDMRGAYRWNSPRDRLGASGHAGSPPQPVRRKKRMADVKDASRRIVFTGASGGIGTMIRPLLAPLYPGLVLSDRVEPKNLLPGETFVAADLTKPDQVAAALKGADTLIHLARFP